jgi:galactose mutarotase-like enzyme
MDSAITLSGDGYTATISPHGAELTSLRGPDGHEHLWGAGPAWPRHAPLLFPMICRQVGGALVVDGQEYPLPQHGFARDRAFAVVEAGPAHALLRLADDDGTRAAYPFPFALEVRWALDGDLRLDVAVTNTGDGVLPFALGWHPAFAWPLDPGADRAAHAVTTAAPEPGPARRVADNLLTADREPSPLAGGHLVLDPALFDRGAVILEDVRSGGLEYRAPSGRAVHLAWTGFDTLALWAKPGADLLCLEPWRGLPAAADAGPVDPRDRADLVQLAAGATFRARCRVAVSPPSTTAG